MFSLLKLCMCGSARGEGTAGHCFNHIFPGGRKRLSMLHKISNGHRALRGWREIRGKKWSGLILIHYSYLIYFYTQNILCPRFNASFYYFLKFPSPSAWGLIIKADESYNRIKPINKLNDAYFPTEVKSNPQTQEIIFQKTESLNIINYRSAVIPQRSRQQQLSCSLHWAFTTYYTSV